MNALTGVHDLLLPTSVDPYREARAWKQNLLRIIVFGFLFGVVMGSSHLRPLQCFYSGVKVPLLLCCSMFFCLPNLMIVATLLGFREEVGPLFGALMKAQATVAVVLASLSPLTLVVYASTPDYSFIVSWNGVLFFIATLAGQLNLARSYAPLIAKDPRYRITQRLWAVLTTFVSIQLAWFLRPFIGFGGLETRFFRQQAWDNAYVVVLRMLVRLFDS